MRKNYHSREKLYIFAAKVENFNEKNYQQELSKMV